MSSRNYLTHQVTGTPAVSHTLGDEVFNPVLNKLYKTLAVNGSTVSLHETIIADTSGTISGLYTFANLLTTGDGVYVAGSLTANVGLTANSITANSISTIVGLTANSITANSISTIDVTTTGNINFTNAGNIKLRTLSTNSGTLSFEGNVGQLFSITNSLSGTIFSVNDISGIPSITVADTGTIALAPYSGNVGVGTSSPTNALVVSRASGTASYIQTISGSAYGLIGVNNVGEVISGAFTNTASVYYSNSLERMRLDAGGNLYIGLNTVTSYNNVRILHTTISSSTTTGALTVAGGIGIGGNLNVAGSIIQSSTGNVLITNTATSTSNITGALTVAGGLGVSGTTSVSGLSVANNIRENVYAVSGTTPALSPVNGTIQTWTLSGSSTPTSVTWNAGESMTLAITAGANTITWTSVAVTWIGATAPTLATSGVTFIQLWKIGSTIYGTYIGAA